MSSGPRDARAESDLANTVDITSLRLAQAIEAARRGHRGMSLTVSWILKSCNTVLPPGFRLVYDGQE